jgi:hypothetical protein
MNQKTIFSIQKWFQAFEIFSFSMILPYFAKHFSYIDILSGYLILFFVPLPIIFFFRKMFTKEFMFSAFIIRALCMFVYFANPNILFMYFYFFLTGLNIFFFWVQYNSRYFSLSEVNKKAISAGYLIIVGPILSAFVPIISAFVITESGYLLLSIISFIILILALRKASNISKIEIKYSFFDIMKKSKGTRTLNFLMGFWESGSMLIALGTLFFIKDELSFGGFLSYLGLVGVIATLVISKISDNQNKRLKFFIPLLILLALSTISLAFTSTLFYWALFAALVSAFSAMAYPFFFAVVLDKIENKAESMIAREYIINTGRFFGILATLILIYSGIQFRYSYIFFGAALLIYTILLLFIKRTYSNEKYLPVIFSIFEKRN